MKMSKILQTVASLGATLLTCSASLASYQFVSGSGSLAFSADALSALSASGATVLTPTTLPEYLSSGAGAANMAAYTKPVLSLTFTAAAVNGDVVNSMSSANSFVNIRRAYFDDNESLHSKSILMGNFEVNLGNATIFADLYTRNNDSAELVSKGRMAIFRADVPGVSGGTAGVIVGDYVYGGTPDGHASGGLNGALRMDLATADIVLANLDLSTAADDPVAKLVRTADWGRTAASGTFRSTLDDGPRPNLPEPSTYALMGMGLGAMCLVARSRRRLVK